MALRYNERTGEFEDTDGGSRPSRRRRSGSSGGSSGGSSSSTGNSCAEKIGQGCGCLIMLFVVLKIAGCIFG